MDLVCKDTKAVCTKSGEISEKARRTHKVQGNGVHTEDCVHVTIHEQNTKKTYACNSDWHQWIKGEIKERGGVTTEQAYRHIPHGCKLLQGTPGDAVNTTPSGDTGSIAAGSMEYTVPAVVGGIALVTVGGTVFGIRKCYNKWG